MLHLPFLMLLFLSDPPFDILGVAGAPSREGIPPGWQVRNVRGQDAPEALITVDRDGNYLRLHGAGRAAWFYREVTPLEPGRGGTLSWTWRVLEAPGGSDLRAEATDDSPLRVYVVFGRQGGLFGGSGRVIFYSYGNVEPPQFAAPSRISNRLHVIRVDGAAERGRWQDHVVEPFADFRRIWNRTPPPITAVGIMQDTDQTRVRAVADLRRLEWRVP